MMSSNNLKGYFLLKTSALLYNLPHIAEEILKDTALKEASTPNFLKSQKLENVKKLVNIYVNVQNPNKELKNTFNPNYKINVPEADHNKLNEYVSSLNSFLKKLDNDIKKQYTFLYALYELVWVNKGLSSLPSEVPIYSIFDQSYAMAMMTNWIMWSDDGKTNGVLLAIDVSGVQAYIEKSRKLRDLWASSYLLSALMWSIILEFIRILGPDIVLTPTLRFNPFFYYYLLSSVNNEELRKELKGYLKFKDIRLIEEEFGYPRLPVIPARATLVLPPIEILDKELQQVLKRKLNNEKDLEEAVRGLFNSKWKDFVNKAVKKWCNQKSQDPVSTLIGKLCERIREFKELLEIPPFGVNVAAVKVEGLSYKEALSKLDYRLGKNKTFRISPLSDSKLTELTERAFQGQNLFMWSPYVRVSGIRYSRGFEYCTMCGYLPSIVQFPRRDRYDRLMRDELQIDISKANLRVYFDEGEKLCTHCLFKRLFSIKPELVIEDLLGFRTLEQVAPIPFPSVSDIAVFDFIDWLLRKCLNNDECSKAFNETLGEYVKKICKLEVLRMSYVWAYQMKMVREIKPEYLNLLLCDLETLLLDKDSTRDELLRKFNERIKEKKPPIRRYYAILLSDADNIGKILRGEVKEGFGIEVKDYIKNAYGAEATGNELIVSPSYHVAISRALMLTALLDASDIEDLGGFVVYAGGDDLLAILPTSKAIEAAIRIRRNYSCGNNDIGCRPFITLSENYYVPTMATASRSAVIYITHAKHPLSFALSEARELLESEAKSERLKWSIDGGLEKDTLCIAYCPRGASAEYAVIPYRTSKEIDNLGELVDIVDKGVKELLPEVDKLPTSFIYKFFDENRVERIYYALKSGITQAYLGEIANLIEERNRSGSEFIKKVRSAVSYMRICRDNKDHPSNCLVYQLFKAIQLAYRGLRG